MLLRYVSLLVSPKPSTLGAIASLKCDTIVISARAPSTPLLTPRSGPLLVMLLRMEEISSPGVKNLDQLERERKIYLNSPNRSIEADPLQSL